jgi:hypothetical protein
MIKTKITQKPHHIPDTTFGNDTDSGGKLFFATFATLREKAFHHV